MSNFNSSVSETFQANTRGGYTAVTTTEGPTNPVYVISTNAATLLEGGEHLELPPGFASDALSSFSLMASCYDREFNIPHYQAAQLAKLGEQLIAHHTNGSIQLDDDELDVIEHMIATVAEHSEVVDIRQ